MKWTVVLLAFFAPAFAQIPESWAPIPAEELALKDNPAEPGSAAMILYKQVHTDDIKLFEQHHVRIKVFTEAGKKYADVEIQYVERAYQVQDIRARVVQPDGTAVDFGGQIFDKTVFKSRRVRVQVKAFTLPAVRAGSILEYSWRRVWRDKLPNYVRNPGEYQITTSFTVPTAEWDLQENLYIRRARFSLFPAPLVRVQWTTIRYAGKEPSRQPDGSILLELENIPGIDAEDFMPPVGMIQSEIHLYYTLGYVTEGGYWAGQSKQLSENLEKYLGRHKNIEREALQVAPASDPPETRLRKLYARVQKLRYLTDEPGALEKPPAPNKNAEDVLNHGYGFGHEINYLFIALARAAGFEAFSVLLRSRVSGVFQPKVLVPNQFNAEVVEVKLPSGAIFLDPATRYCPYGLLPWEESNAGGIRLNPKAAAEVMTPMPGSGQAVTTRTATLRLSRDGTLEGQLKVAYTGQEALDYRRAMSGRDDTGLRKAMEGRVKSWLPAGATVEITTPGHWEDSDDLLSIECHIKVPSFVYFQGRRAFFPAAVFNADRPAFLVHANRVHDIYFPYPYQVADNLTIELPPGFEAEALPASRKQNTNVASFENGVLHAAGKVEFTRRLAIEGIYFLSHRYPEVKAFFEKVRSSDDEKIVVRTQ